MRFSVNDLLNYQRCQRLLFLNKYGDKSQQLPPTDFLKRLWKMGRGYESKVTDFFEFEKPKYKIGDHEKGKSETIKLMEKGVETIYQGVLLNDEIVGIPDFLIKAPGYSIFGDYYYYPVDVKGASTAKERYLFQLACYSYLLGETQEFTPLTGGILLLDLDMQIRDLHTAMPKVISSIEGSQEILKNEENLPDLFIDSNCTSCQWYDFCYPEAVKGKDLSLLPLVRKDTKKSLKSISIHTYDDLANCTDDDLCNIKELSGDKGKSLLIQAKCLTENKFYLKSVPRLPETSQEVFFDFESDFVFDDKGTTMSRIDYLIGVLEHNGAIYEYNHLLLDDEPSFVKAFENYLKLHLDHVFYHYGHYESNILNGKWNELPKVELFNIEKSLRDAIIMPVTSYSLKNIAKALGFKWKNHEASAMQSMCWYSSYLETKDKKYLDLSIQYNEDDCRALMEVKEWLAHIKDKNLPVGEFIDFEKMVK